LTTEVELFDYEGFEERAIAGLRNGSGLVGAQGVLTALIQRLVNAALKGEMGAHLQTERSEGLINLYQPSSTPINLHQPLSTLINLYQPLSTLINPHQPP
jgi:hypothetical protein